MNRLKRCTHEAVYCLFRNHHGKIIDLCSAMLCFKLPVIEGCDLGNHISDTRVEEFLRCTFDYVCVYNNAISHTCGNRAAPFINKQGSAGAGKAITGSRSRHADEGKLTQKSHIFGGINDFATAQTNDRLCGIGQRKGNADDIIYIDCIQFTIFQNFNSCIVQGRENLLTEHVNQTISKINNDFL